MSYTPKIQVVQDMERIQKNLPEKFTYEDFIKKGEEYKCPINLKKPHFDYLMPAPVYLRVMMGFTCGDFDGKRVLFDRFVYRIMDMRNRDI